MGNEPVLEVRSIQSQKMMGESMTSEISLKKTRKWILWLIVCLLAIVVLVCTGVFYLLPLTQKKEATLEQKKQYQIIKPTKNEIFQAFYKANNEVSELNVPINKIVDFVYPFFYPPNGYEYDDIQVTISEYPRESDRCEDDYCKEGWRDKTFRDGYKVIYVRLVGQYDNFQDTFLLGLKYTSTPSKEELPSSITLNSFSEGISSSLASKLDSELEKSTEVKSFLEKYSMTHGVYSFYRSGISEELDSEYPLREKISWAGLSDEKDWIVVDYIEPGFGIPESPKERLFVYIDPTIDRVVKVK